jgi:hypothetical protein
MARQFLCAAGVIVCLGVSVFSSETNAQSPAPHPVAPASAIQTIDAASLSNVLNLDGRWRFHSGDDSRFADPQFDDQAWPSAPADLTSPRFLVMPQLRKTEIRWARLHFKVARASGPLALALAMHDGIPYQIFVNERKAAESPGFQKEVAWVSRTEVIPIPPAEDVVVAIRFDSPNAFLPVDKTEIGNANLIAAATDLARTRLFNAEYLQYHLGGLFYLSFVPIAIILFLSQRTHAEYLWLGFFCLFLGIFAILEASAAAGHLPMNGLPAWVLMYSGHSIQITNLEFVRHFVRSKPLRWLRVFQAALLFVPLVTLYSMELYFWFYLAIIAGWLIIASTLLWRSYRRGQVDSGLLLGPLSLYIAFSLFSRLVRLRFSIGPVGIDLDVLSAVFCLAGIVGVVLYRFLLISREKQRAEAEFEAARTVQQILVPEEIPSIPGFSIQAVYHPAGQVGGDFYQVLPTPNGGLLAVIGDVSGKGMPAAMTVSLLVGTVRTLAHYTYDPAGILAAMNQRLIGRGSGFTTALVLRLDRDGTLTAANAGHIAPYANGNELAIDNGLPLGVTATAAYSNSTLHLESNTTLTLLTDGVVEAQNAKGELFGFDRTAAISSKPAQHVAEAAQTFGQQDDITVLSLALVVGG